MSRVSVVCQRIKAGLGVLHKEDRLGRCLHIALNILGKKT